MKEADHLRALEEARMQARRDRKMVDAKRKALESTEVTLQPSAPSSVPEEKVDEALREAQHVEALKEAAAEARRERRLLQEKAQREALEDLYGLESLKEVTFQRDLQRCRQSKAEAQRLSEARRYRELAEASAEARRERRQLRERIRELEWGAGSATLQRAGHLSLSRPTSEEHLELREQEGQAAYRNETLGSLSYSLTVAWPLKTS